MKTLTTVFAVLFATIFVAASTSQVFGQATAASPSVATSPVAAPPAAAGAPNPDEMMKQMMEMSKLNENHKLLTSLDGTWNYTVKLWMNPDPKAKPEESKGVATRKSIMDGRYVVMDVTGHMQMPGPNGKMKDTTFKGMGLEAYDNVKKKFVGTWMDNMGTSIMMSEGTYDAATKTFSYVSEEEPAPGMKVPVRESLKLTDKDHMTFEWYETHGGQEKKMMEINYTRSGGGKKK